MRVVKLIINKYFSYKNPYKYWCKKGLCIGKNCKIASSADFGSEPYLITLGNDVRITNKVKFITHDGAASNVIKNVYGLSDVELFKKIKVGNNVFIGNNATIMPGVIIGDNVIIGYGAIVTKNIPSNEVWAGVPAKKICTIDEYYLKNKSNFVCTLSMSEKEKKNYLLDRLNNNDLN